MFTDGERPTIVFAGGGHAHLYSLRRTRELRQQGFDVVLINPSRFLYYSGMAPGLLSRIYRPEEDRIDVKYLVEKGGGRFVKDKIEGILSGERKVVLESGEALRYDAMSVCLGSGVPDRVFIASEDYLTPVKPVENMENLHWELRKLKGGRDGRKPEVLVVGGGPAGCEMASNSLKVFRDHGIDGRITLVNADDVLLKSAPRRAQKEIERFLTSRGVEVLLGSEVVKVENNAAYTADGRRLGFDLLILAVGINPPDIFRRSGLATAHDDGLFVNHYLQSVSDPRLFGGGDSVSFRGEALTRLGVFAIRQAPVLYHNLQAVVKGEPLEPFEPQSAFLYVLNLGNYEGLAVYGPLSWRGSGAWRLKDYIDRKFMGLYQYPEDEPGEVREYFDRLPAEDAGDLGRGIGSLEERTRGVAEIPGDDPESAFPSSGGVRS